MNSSPHHLFGSPAAPSRLHSPRVPSLDLLHPPLWCGGWQALFDYSAGLGCEVRKDAWVEIAGGGAPPEI